VLEDEVQDVGADPTTEGTSDGTLDVGTKVYVRDRYQGQWSGGFDVAEVCSTGYRIRRISDGQIFPDVFPFDDVRVERRKQPLRGIEGSYLDRRKPT
jgi:hypothetical protein